MILDKVGQPCSGVICWCLQLPVLKAHPICPRFFQGLQLAESAWAIKEYHRGIKQFCGVERWQVLQPALNVTISAWYYELSSALNVISLLQASVSFMPKPILFDKQFSLI